MLRIFISKTTIAAAALTALGFGATIFTGTPTQATATEAPGGSGVTYVMFEGTPEMLDQPVYVLASGTPVGGTAAQMGLNSVPVPTIPGASYQAISPMLGEVPAAVADGRDYGDEGME